GLVELFGLLLQRAPLARNRVPRVGRAVLLRRQLLGFFRELVQARVGARHFETVVVPRANAGACRLEPFRERLVDRRIGIDGETLPFRARLLEPIQGVFAVERLEPLAGRRLDAARGAELRLARVTLG